MENESLKTRYSDLELEEFRILIQNKLDKAYQELDYLRDQIVELSETDDYGGDWIDDSSLLAESSILSEMAARQRLFIQNLEAALIRIKNKTYGICSVTGALIDKNRLRLVPHATKSIAAKEITQDKVERTLEPEMEEDEELRELPVVKKEKPKKIISRVVSKNPKKKAEPQNKEEMGSLDWNDEEDDLGLLEEESFPADDFDNISDDLAMDEEGDDLS